MNKLFIFLMSFVFLASVKGVSAGFAQDYILNPNSQSGYNSMTYLEVFENWVDDGVSSQFNTTKTITNATGSYLVVPWFDSATSCGESNLKASPYIASASFSTNYLMVADEFSEVGIALAMSNNSAQFESWYNTLGAIKSSWGGLPWWIVNVTPASNKYVDVSGDDTASDADARIIKALYIAKQNPYFSTANKTKYGSKADNLSSDFIIHDVVRNVNYNSGINGNMTMFVFGGRDSANAGFGATQADMWIGYYPDVIEAMLMAYESTGNNTYYGASLNFTLQALIASNATTPYTSSTWRGGHFNFEWNVTTNPVRTYNSSAVDQIYWNQTGTAWGDSDGVRFWGMCDVLRAVNLSTGATTGAFSNLSDYCRVQPLTNLYNATKHCLEVKNNGACHVTVQGGYYENGLGSGAVTFYNTSWAINKSDEFISHYGFSGNTFDSTACGNPLTYRGIRPTKALGSFIGLDSLALGGSQNNISGDNNLEQTNTCVYGEIIGYNLVMIFTSLGILALCFLLLNGNLDIKNPSFERLTIKTLLLVFFLIIIGVAFISVIGNTIAARCTIT